MDLVNIMSPSQFRIWENTHPLAVGSFRLFLSVYLFLILPNI